MREALIISLFVVYLVAGAPSYLLDPSASALLKALTYHFFHANIFHLAANCLSIWFVFKVTPSRATKDNVRNFLTAFAIATLTYFIPTRPVIGISNVLFAVLGLRTPPFSSLWWRQPSTLTFFGITLLMLAIPQVAALTHIASFCVGVAVASLARSLKSIKHDYDKARG